MTDSQKRTLAGTMLRLVGIAAPTEAQVDEAMDCFRIVAEDAFISGEIAATKEAVDRLQRPTPTSTNDVARMACGLAVAR